MSGVGIDLGAIPPEVELARLWEDSRGDNQCTIEVGQVNPTWHPNAYPGTGESDLDWACEIYLVWVTDRSDLIDGNGHGADWVEYRWRFSGPTFSACAAAALAWCQELLPFAVDEGDQ